MDRRADLAVAFVGAGYGIALLVLTSQMEPGITFDLVGKQGLPYFTGVAMTLMSFLLIAERLKSWSSSTSHRVLADGAEDEPGHAASGLRAMAVMVATVTYAVGFHYLGFIISSPVFVLAALLLLRVRSVPMLVLAPVAYTVVMYLVFDVLLMVRLSLGPLGPLLFELGLIDRIR